MDPRAFQRELDRLERRIAELESRLLNLPVRWGGGGDSPLDAQWVRVKNASAASSGSNSTAGTINYDIYAWTNDGTTPTENLIASGVSLAVPRWVQRTLAAADGCPALAYQNPSGTWQLIAVFGETRGHLACLLP